MRGGASNPWAVATEFSSHAGVLTWCARPHAQGDNWGEGTLDTHMISAFGMNVSTLVSNTNTSISTEEGEGFGLAFLDFVTQLASRPKVPHVLSLSLGSLSAASCDLLCTEAAKGGEVSLDECRDYLQQQRCEPHAHCMARAACPPHGARATCPSWGMPHR